MGKNNKVYLLPPRGRNSSKLAPKYTYETTTERYVSHSVNVQKKNQF